MNKVLLLGAAGQLGKLVSQTAPDSVSLLASKSNELDITNEKALSLAIEESRPDLIINCAAYTQVDKAEEEEQQANWVNAEAVKFLALHAPQQSRIIHLSTDFVFSKPSESPYTPDSAPCPISVYGKSKLAGEKALLEIRPHNSVILRTSWLYSADNRNFVTVILALLSEQEELKVVNDQYGSPTSAYTLAEIIWRFASCEKAEGIFHWSDSGVITWYDFAKEIQRQGLALGLLKKEIPIHAIPTSEYSTSAKRPVYSALDSSSTEKFLGLETLPWQKQLREVLMRINGTQ